MSLLLKKEGLVVFPLDLTKPPVLIPLHNVLGMVPEVREESPVSTGAAADTEEAAAAAPEAEPEPKRGPGRPPKKK